MKRLFAAILCLCLLAGCGGKGSTGDTCGTKDDPAAGTEKVEPAGEAPAKRRCLRGRHSGSSRSSRRICCWLRQMVTRRMCIPCPCAM